jgi:hypothetical protein
MAGFSLQWRLARQPCGSHTHLRDIDTSGTPLWDNNAVGLITDAHQTRCLVSEPFGKPGEYIRTLNDMGIS